MEKIYRAVHEKKLASLLEVAEGNLNKAHFLDLLVKLHRSSRITLPSSKRRPRTEEQKKEVWATYTWDKIFNMSQNSCKAGKSTLKKYMKDFCESGFIERTQAKPGKNVCMYFRVTVKGYNKLKANGFFENHFNDDLVAQPELVNSEINNIEDILDRLVTKKLAIIKNTTPEARLEKNLKNIDTSEDLDMRSSINTDPKQIKVNSITSFPKRKRGKLYNLPERVSVLFEEIGERLEECQKQRLWGAVCNVYKEKRCFNPHEITAWMAYQLINNEHHLPNISGFKDRLNILIDKLRKGLYEKPTGFHNHFDIGVQMKKSAKMARITAHKEKIDVPEKNKDPKAYYRAKDAQRYTSDGESIFDSESDIKSQKNDVHEINKEISNINQKKFENISRINFLKNAISQSDKGIAKCGFKASMLKPISNVQIAEYKEELFEKELLHKQYLQAINELNEQKAILKHHLVELEKLSKPSYREAS
jgi:hypothetical protein